MWSPQSAAERSAKAAERRSSSPTTPWRRKNPGRRITQIVKLKPEFVDKYKEAHVHVWPEVLKQIKHCNIEDCMSNTNAWEWTGKDKIEKKWNERRRDTRSPIELTGSFYRQHLPRPRDGNSLRDYEIRWLRLCGRHGAHEGEPKGSRVVGHDGQLAGVSGARRH